MDELGWLRKIEEEQQEEQQRKIQSQAAEFKRESEEKENFRIVKNKLCPVIKDSISEIKKRTGVELQMDVMDSSLIVSSPRRDEQHTSYVDGYRGYEFVVSKARNDGSVYVEAIKNTPTLLQRNPPPEHFEGSDIDWYGGRKIVIDIRNNLDLLVSEDIHFLLEWLVKSELHSWYDKTPEISSLRHKRRKEEIESKSYVGWGFLFWILSGMISMGLLNSPSRSSDGTYFFWVILFPIIIGILLPIVLKQSKLVVIRNKIKEDGNWI